MTALSFADRDRTRILEDNRFLRAEVARLTKRHNQSRKAVADLSDEVHKAWARQRETAVELAELREEVQRLLMLDGHRVRELQELAGTG